MSSGQQPQQNHPTEVDPISKFKVLVPHLKESLAVSLRSVDTFKCIEHNVMSQ